MIPFKLLLLFDLLAIISVVNYEEEPLNMLCMDAEITVNQKIRQWYG